MKSYLLFFFGDFEDKKDLDFFISDILKPIKQLQVIDYVIEQNKQLIILFKSNSNEKELSYTLGTKTDCDAIKFCFLFEKSGMLLAKLSNNYPDFVKKIQKNDEIDNIEEISIIEPQLDIDEILDKINTLGMNSLTTEEKTFLENYNK